jgi:hypothetical protein
MNEAYPQGWFLDRTNIWYNQKMQDIHCIFIAWIAMAG